MKKTVVLLLTLGLTQALYCQRTVSQKLDELMQAYSKVNKFNGTVLISRKGELLLRKGYGIQNARTNTPNGPNSIFQIYSVTKAFTSTVVLKLVELGKLSLSDKLSKFYPAFPKGDSITIEHLLTHTSGIYDYTRGNNMPDQTERSFIDFIQTKPLDFSPGGGWNYSNSGYWLLGFIIAKVTGLSYEAAVRKYIFEPLHMNHSGFNFKHLSDKNKTAGYSIFSAKVKKEAEVYDPPGPFAAGAIHSTVDDLYKFYKGLQSNKIITAASLKKASTPFRNNYGYGWITGIRAGKQVVSHSGGAAGYRSNFAMVPEDDICIILLNNHENAYVDLITKNLLHILYAKPYKLPADIQLPALALTKFTGVFSVTPSLTLYITKEDDRLMVQAKGKPKTPLLAEKENYFYSEEADSFVEFIRDEKGDYTALVLTPGQGGEPMKGKRIYPTWGIMGTATSKGWEESVPDIQLTEDSLKRGLWTIKNIALKTGLMVFRLNNDWGYHFGDNKNDQILDMFGKDISVEAGMYDIILDLTNEMEPKYTITKK